MLRVDVLVLPVVLGTSHGMALRDLGVPEGVGIVNASQSGLGVAPLMIKTRYLVGQLEKVRNVVIVVVVGLFTIAVGSTPGLNH